MVSVEDGAGHQSKGSVLRYKERDLGSYGTTLKIRDKSLVNLVVIIFVT